MLCLNLGCGAKHLPGFVNVDHHPVCRPDACLDLDEVPWPWKDGEVDEVVFEHSLEHLREFDRPLREVWRICRPGAPVLLKVPHFSLGWINPYHRRAFSIRLVAYYNKFNPDRVFDIEKAALRWYAGGKRLPRGIGSVVDFVAQISPRFCERLWVSWVGGFEEIEFRLRVRK